MPTQEPQTDLLTVMAAEMWAERNEGQWPPYDASHCAAYLAFARSTVDAIEGMSVGQVAELMHGAQ